MNELMTIHDSTSTNEPARRERAFAVASSNDSETKERPYRTLFLLTSMPIGGAETLLVNMLRRFDTHRLQPEVACLKERGALGEAIASDFAVTSNWIRNKYDVGVAWRLADYMRREKFDAVITVGAGDKMFWGRIAAKLAGVPVICSALHSTGWPDGVGLLNRTLTPITDAFIAVAKPHGDFLVSFEKFPARKVVVIPNGVDTDRFVPNPVARKEVREEFGIPFQAQLVGIVAALRPEKNHAMFLEGAAGLLQRFPNAYFLIVGDGQERSNIEAKARELGIQHRVIMAGSRSDTPRLVASLDVFALTSHNEASPVSIMEAMACGVPVVATRVGSVGETVLDGWNGFSIEPGDVTDLGNKLGKLLSNRELASVFGANGRQHIIENSSLDKMVSGYEELIDSLYQKKRRKGR